MAVIPSPTPAPEPELEQATSVPVSPTPPYSRARLAAGPAVVTARDIARADARTGRIVYADAAFEHAFAIAAVVGLVGVLVAVLMRHGRTPATGGATSGA
ncbi:hypothetical protein ACIRL2_47635 [Embleya sp. NPDC127516]|uniref:hypothetical protein n=1 Tax=Embleya sp. NPDC127516 TaxID=3363990 RepID=UPI003829E98F